MERVTEKATGTETDLVKVMAMAKERDSEKATVREMETELASALLLACTCRPRRH